MKTLRMALLAGALMGTTGLVPVMAQEVPEGYPESYAETIAAGQAEGRVVIYTSTDAAQSQALLDAFTEKYGIAVEYNDLGTNGAYNRAIAEAAANQMGADILWSSAMDLQMVLAYEGYMVAYDSPEKPNLPEWAMYEDTLFASTVEPIGMIYNTNALSESEVPKTRADLIAFLNDNSEELKGRIATFDPEGSGSGFLHHTADAQMTDSFWDLASALGAVGVKTYSSSGAMRETVVSGENILAVNIIGSYALDWVKDSPNLGAAFGEDYTAAFSRLFGIMDNSPNPEAAKLFVDFALSQEGQAAIASGGMPSVRSDVDEGLNFNTLNELVGGNLRPIPLDDNLLAYMEPPVRLQFFNDWKAAISGN